MVNTPLPQSLEDECKKAAKILKSFTMDKTSSGGIDRPIPPTLIANCKGLAILTVVKAGFLVTARAGSGLVVARLSDGTWSAPSAIATAGIGGGLEIGAEITDFIFILNSPQAVEAFSKGGNVTLGGNLSVAVGPLGRNAEADVALRSPAAIYTYSKTQGLFAGISLEGSAIFERKDANKKMYRQDVRSKQLLDGSVQPPDEALPLYNALLDHTRGILTDAVDESVSRAKSYASSKGYSFNNESPNSSGSRRFSLSGAKKGGGSGGGGGGGAAAATMTYSQQRESAGSSGGSWSSSSKSGGGSGGRAPPRAGRSSGAGATAAGRRSSRKGKDDGATGTGDINAVWDVETVVQAKWDYFSDTPGDLSFRKGDRIIVITQTGKQNDWWEGKLRGQVGIFPANFVAV